MQIRGKKALLQKVVFELRYRYGYTYLDKCGRTINTIMREQPEWVVRESSPNPQNAGLVSMRNGSSFNFSALSLNLSMEKPSSGEPLGQEEIKDFTGQADILSNLVIDQLGLNDFTRIGFRMWYLFGCKSKEEAEKWILDLGYYTVSPNLSKVFNGEIEITNSTIIISSFDRKIRIGLNSVENQAQLDIGREILNIRSSSLSKDQDKFLIRQMQAKRRVLVNPGFAVMIDLDAFQEVPISVDPRDFIETSVLQIEKGLQTDITSI